MCDRWSAAGNLKKGKSMPKVTKIKPVLGFQKVPDADLLKQLNTIRERMNGNPNYANPPLSMDTLKRPWTPFRLSFPTRQVAARRPSARKRNKGKVGSRWPRTLATRSGVTPAA